MADAMFERILSKPDVFYRHQQNNEPDLTTDDKRQILTDLLQSNKALFLQRYGQYMNAVDCDIFREETDPLIKFMVGQIELKTRRFLALQKLKEKGKYFSDEKMREREPYLYDVMVGKFISEEALLTASDRINLRPSVSREECAEGGWANMLCQFESSREIAQRRNEHHTQWEREEKESRQSERLSRMEAHVSNMFSTREDEMEDEEDDLDDGLDELREEVNRISQEEAELMEEGMDDSPDVLRREFEAYMQERFLAGMDSRFIDYDTIDYDTALDEGDDIRARDLEEKWFDADDDIE
ncbi:hypothetical protein ANCDUO_06897 [Ancylostoma duodenale]|uniref:CCD97-like C-terminal domain-containing protein n=1 Tax=Ancylostoma duodenale TaxID=51022 RepID=A0A0C2H0F2_9BILA|nr:hypothetical protein ANCDUO_06897 [Ancylostoma duodenale]